MCVTKINKVSNWVMEWGRERELAEAVSFLPLMLALHVTFPDVHVHTVLRSVCQLWPSSTSRPSHTHRCLTHSHPSRYCTRDCRSAFYRKTKTPCHVTLYHSTVLFYHISAIGTWVLTMSSMRASSSTLFSSFFSLSSFCAWETDLTPWGDPGGPSTTPLCSWSLWKSWG